MARLLHLAEPLPLSGKTKKNSNSIKRVKGERGIRTLDSSDKELCRFSRPELLTTQPSLQHKSIFILFVFPRMEHGHLS